MLKLRNVETFKFLSKIVFILYLFLLIWVVVFKCNIFLNGLYIHYEKMAHLSIFERISLNSIPFIEYFLPEYKYELLEMLRDDLLNILLFVPFGLYLSYFSTKNKLFKTVLIILLSSFLLEVFQLFSLLGVFSTKDIILNILGGILGYLIYKLIYRESRVMIFNIISMIIIIFSFSLSIYALINTIKNIEVYLDIILRRA
ncbi:MAG: VanZ family protein [Clostridia bacterium]|nr:VanZ family protein [Clostridia bacterium]